MIIINIPGKPVPQGRPRFARVGQFVKVYDPKTSKDWKRKVALIAKQEMKRKPLMDGPLDMEISIFVAISTSWSRAKKDRASNREMFPVSKPDLDNTAKAVMDALTGVVYQDDKQIVSLLADKSYSGASMTIVKVKNHALT